MANGILAITDGTTTISLLDTMGFCLKGWRPNLAPWKAGGYWTETPFSDGRWPSGVKYDNTTDIFTLNLQQPTQDRVISSIRELRVLLDKATQYWTNDWQTEPVWLEARGPDETNVRYAVILAGSLPSVSSAYEAPFWNSLDLPGIPDLALAIEHQAWREMFDGASVEVFPYTTITNGTPLSISAEDGFFNARDYGQEETSDPYHAVVMNKHNVANITDIYTWVSAAGPFSANLLGGGVPFDLFTGGAAGPANGDITYFGCDTTIADSGPFNNLVFDLAVAATYGAGDGVTIEYWNGAWVTLRILSDVVLSSTGINVIEWDQPADWATCAVNGVTGFWVRFVVTEATGVSRAQQQTRDVYSCTWPFIDIAADEVPGDMAALAAHYLLCDFSREDNPALGLEGSDRVHIGLRQYDRGSKFTAYLNPVTDQTPGYSWIDDQGALQVDPSAPAGAVCDYSGGVLDTWERVGTFVLDKEHFAGVFHCYLRYRMFGLGVDGQYSFRVSVSGREHSQEVDNIAALGEYYLADLGIIRMPLTAQVDEAALGGDFRLEIQARTNVAGAINAYIVDLIIMPVDEWSILVESDNSSTDAALTDGHYFYYLLLNGISRPKSPLSSLSSYTQAYIPYGSEGYRIVPNARQRLWFLFGASDPTTPTLDRYYHAAQGARVFSFRSARYQLMRGDS